MKTAYETTLSATGAATIRTASGAMVTQHLDGTTAFIKQLPQTLSVICGTVLKRNKN
jgi:protein PhnA